MKDLAVRLAALDADASAAVQVIAYFDSLVEAGAGVQSIVRGAAVLAGCPARLDDQGRRVHIRMLPDGVAAPGHGAVDERWPHGDVGGGVLWLERAGEPGPVDAMVLERAARAARTVLDRTRGRAATADDVALVEVVVDGSAPPETRLRAARHLGLETSAYAVAEPGGVIRVRPATAAPPATRAGVGPTGPVLELPESCRAARIALRFTDDDVPVVAHADLGSLAVLATVPDPGAEPDVRALEQAAATAPWLPSTLHAVVTSPSLRAAATALRLHHSSLQDRVVQAEHLLGWTLRTPAGLLRAHLALWLRRLHRNL